jgi:hypothetical protein
MQLPVQEPKTSRTFQTLEDIQTRKEELLEQLQTDNNKFGRKWSQLVTPSENSSKAEFVGSLLANSITVIDVLLTVRKLYKTYGGIFGLGKKKKKR